MTKCTPLKCRRFKRVYDKTWDKTPVDKYVVSCPHREKDGECTEPQQMKK